MSETTDFAPRSLSSQHIGASYARFSSEHQKDTSIDDQQRVCRDRAERDGVLIDPRFEFSDRAVSGTVLVREGLDALRAAARDRKFSVLYVYSTSRLGRESTFTFELLKELVLDCKVRLVSASEGIDSSHECWYDMSVFTGLQHERYVKDLSNHVRRGQEGTVLQGFSIGDLCYGYESIPAPNGETVGRGRDAKPRKVYSVVRELANWVLQMFRWYGDEHRTLGWIVDELNRLKAPKYYRCSKESWNRDMVVRILRNEKYVGRWPWRLSKRVRSWKTGKVRQVAVPENERSQFTRELPELQIVDTELFDRVRDRLNKNSETFRKHRKSDGRLSGSPPRGQKRHLLDGLFVCKACRSRFAVLDHEKRFYICAGRHRNQCGCKARVPRELAESMIVDVVTNRLLKNATWQAAAHSHTTAIWQSLTTDKPDALSALRSKQVDLEGVLEHLMQSIEKAPNPPAKILERIEQRTRELEEVKAEIVRESRVPGLPAKAPTSEEIEEHLRNLFSLLRSGTPAAIESFQKLIDGPVVLEEVPIPNRKRKFLKGTVRLRSLLVTQSVLRRDVSSTEDHDTTETIELAFRREDDTSEHARRAHALWHEGKRCIEIAEELGVTPNHVTTLFKYAAKNLNLPYPSTTVRKRLEDSLYTRIESTVMDRWNAGALIGQIADELGVNRATVKIVVDRWYEKQGTAMPDGRTRRKSLTVKQREILLLATPSPSEHDTPTGTSPGGGEAPPVEGPIDGPAGAAA